MNITPELAKSWLGKNTRNRSMDDRRVRSYSEDMQSGNWKDTHQGVAFFADDTLCDGQHRLAAIVHSGVTVEMLVSFGLENDSSVGVDAHRARKANDILKIMDSETWIGTSEIATARAIISAGTQRSTSVSIVLEFINRHETAIRLASRLNKVGKNIRGLSNSGIMGAIACASVVVSKDKLDQFIRAIKTGEIPENGSPILRLREKLLSGSINNGWAGRIRIMRLTMRAIKAFDDGENITKFYEPEYYIYEPLR